MISEEEVFSKLDNFRLGYYCDFIGLGNPSSYLIDSRLNIFKGDDNQWAIAAERLGFPPCGAGITLDIYYFGNCLINLETYNNQDTNNYTVTPIEWNDFFETCDIDRLKPDAKFWQIRGQQIELSHKKEDYNKAGIQLLELEPGQIRLEEVGRYLITKCGDLLRATDDELYKSIPKELKKILVIDEWYHRDFGELFQPNISDEHLKATYEFNKNLTDNEYPLDYESFAAMFRKQEQVNKNYNESQWQDNRPSSYETWQLIAKVISTGDISYYKPTLKPNSHWSNWPDSGSI
ncbi:MAG TPA: hypothetical protein P5158_02960 [Chitinophagaceae bacterium]|nr:hypothetical protein [Chitinophagaceae bacterium]